MRSMGFNLQSLLSLVLEGNCPLCGRSTSNPFCLDCQRQVQHCQLGRSHQLQAGQPSVFAWGSYGGSLKRAISAFKYDNAPDLAKPLGEWMAQAWLAANSAPATVIPIPLHASKQQQRGFNQAALLADRFCTIARLPLEAQGLVRSRATEAQFGLDKQARDQNLQAAFTLNQSLIHRPPVHPVLLLDDIYTTGATARSAIQTLRYHGIRVWGIVVLARTIGTLNA